MSNPEYSHQEQSMFHYSGWFITLNTLASGQLIINCVTWYAYDAADAMDDDNYATVLESFVSTSSMQVAQGRRKH